MARFMYISLGAALLSLMLMVRQFQSFDVVSDSTVEIQHPISETAVVFLETEKFAIIVKRRNNSPPQVLILLKRGHPSFD